LAMYTHVVSLFSSVSLSSFELRSLYHAMPSVVNPSTIANAH